MAFSKEAAFALVVCMAGLGLPSVARAEHVDKWLAHASSDAARLPAKNIGNEVLYQIFVDRFSNGNPTNDCLDGERFCDPLHQDWYKFWGGDLRGVIDRLPYLKELGVTRVWLTPILDNQMVTIERRRYGRDIEMTPYHGYWVRDWFRLNPYFTDTGRQDYALVDELIAKAEPEIKLLLDAVVNHTSPSDATAWSLDYVTRREPPLDQSDGIKRTQRGALFRDGAYVASFDEDQQRGGGARRYHDDRRIGDDDWDDSWRVENWQLDALADLDQTNPTIESYLRDAHAFWLERFPGLAGYRMDTIKHVNHSYWKMFDRELYAAHPNTEIVGEYYAGGPSNAGARQFYRETQMTMFDFEFREAVRTAFLDGGSMSRFVELWGKDPELLDARALVTFIDNHDLQRLRGMGMSEGAMRQALAMLFVSRGIPCVYYGLEQDLFHPDDPGDPYNRPMMARFDTSHPLYELTQKLARLRRENSALRYGRTHVVHESRHILAFERVHEGRHVLMALSKNPIAGADRFTIEGLTLPDGTYRDVLSGKEHRVVGGRLPVALGNGDVILLADRPQAP